ncbi:MAG: polysaccharide biosynthesis protein [Saprospiraceae bacterium]|jgi:FlaA1/EpsC-like NDP-sugar epimerase|nr:polysaccharide biosynthesis protein [Saprospiraceae bacterium]
MQLININNFIKEYITHREQSLFAGDLLEYNAELSEKIYNKSVLVIGGAGTIGSSFVHAILKFRPAKLYIVDTNENGLTELTRDLRSTENQYIPVDYKTYPMDFATDIFRKMVRNEGPFQIVANFAAHKHVRSEKDKYSIEAMLGNNVFNAKQLLDFLSENPPEHFFCVSTDKAANPVNVMGASKKLMEETIMAYSTSMKITTARFANVAFSNGSLLDGYIYRLMKQQPLACPGDVKRFFVSPEESGQICLLACILGNSGEIYFPKLHDDQMVYFKDITINFLEQSGKTVIQANTEEEAKAYFADNEDSHNYPVYFFTSDTSGEKLYEEFYDAQDIVDLELYQGMGVIKNAKVVTVAKIETIIEKLKMLMQQTEYDKSDIVLAMKEILPDFQHIETGKSLDGKM